MGKPNIVLFLSDQHNAGVLGCAGDPWIRTPNIDELAAQGTYFSNCYTNSPLCVPSRSSLLSGKLPTNTGVFNNMQCLRSDQVTIAHLMAAAGYETVLVGRMHFMGFDQRHGFERRLVGDITSAFDRPDLQEELLGDLDGTMDQSRVSVSRSGAGHTAVLDYDQNVADEACRYLEERTDPRPLFLVVGTFGPHCPFVAPPELYDYYEGLLAHAAVDQGLPEHPALQRWADNRRVSDVTPDEIRRVRAAYYGLVEFQDRLVGQVVRATRRHLGETGNVLIYSSDHGESMGDHGLFWKSNFYESAVRIPLIVSAPGMLGGQASDWLCSIVDFAPTIAELGGADALPGADGRSLAGLWSSDESMGQEHPVISQLIDIKGDLPSAMVRLGRYKYVSYCGYEEVQLFDLEVDPNEDRNLGDDPGYASVVDSMQGILSSRWNEDKALAELESCLAHIRVLESWRDAVNPPRLDEWAHGPLLNYLRP